MKLRLPLLFLLQDFSSTGSAFSPLHARKRKCQDKKHIFLAKKRESWSVGDDWSTLSSDSPQNGVDGASIFNIDPASEAAKEMSYSAESDYYQSAEDSFIAETMDTINSPIHEVDSPDLFDTSYKENFEEYTKTESFLDEMGKEISLLVRCNESPDQLLVSLGKKLPDLEDAEKYSAEQLFTTLTDEDKMSGIVAKPTRFFEGAVTAIFHIHASPRAKGTNEIVLFPEGIASWISRSLGEKVGKFDRRISIVLGKYSSHGSGFLTLDQFLRLYIDAGMAPAEKKVSRPLRSTNRGQKRDEAPNIKSVWRDLENHGFHPPIVEERALRQEELDERYGKQKVSDDQDKDMVDECEILEWNDGIHSTPRASSSSQMKGATPDTKKSSHEYVELSSDNKTPSRLRDGEFVFIDEESCIGCKQCATVAPSSFQILDNGRARTCMQSNMKEVNTAVSICPVDCMHNVAFHELVELETSRDVEGDFSTKGHIPLHVARIDSDMNRRNSWYHSLKHKCFTSKSCPQRGCFDCPMYNEPGANPHFKRLHQKSEHIRATDFIKSGKANSYRKIADL